MRFRVLVYFLVLNSLLMSVMVMAAEGPPDPRAVSADGPGKYALIYNGPISAEDCPEAAAAIAQRAGLKTRFIGDLTTLPGLLKDAAVFIIGGTEDEMGPMVRAFTPQLATALKDYLRKGGRYLGICGGGFMASTGWDEGPEHMKGLGIVPAGSSVFQNSFEPRIIPVRWLGKTRPMYFQAGPCFHPVKKGEAVKVIATYSDGNIAALISTYGKGRVAVCGPHPEARESWKDRALDSETWTSSTDLAVQLLKDLLSDRPPGK